MTDFWDREVLHEQHNTWLEEPAIHEYTNALIGGWSVDWFHRWLGGRTFERALSIGCGGGALERGLIERGVVKTIDAFDGSLTSLHVARGSAPKAVHYFAADFDRGVPSRARYDLVVFHQSAHHVLHLERVFLSVLNAITPDGIVFLDEYIGPARGDWTDDGIAPQRAFFDALPDAMKVTPKMLYPIHPDDPSEGIRSSEIESRLRIGFDVIEKRPYGGTLLALVYPLVRERSPQFIQSMIEAERRLLASGAPSYYAVIVAKPKKNRLAAKLQYAIEAPFTIPKLVARRFARRVTRKIRRLASRR